MRIDEWAQQMPLIALAWTCIHTYTHVLFCSVREKAGQSLSFAIKSKHLDRAENMKCDLKAASLTCSHREFFIYIFFLQILVLFFTLSHIEVIFLSWIPYFSFHFLYAWIAWCFQFIYMCTQCTPVPLHTICLKCIVLIFRPCIMSR